MILKRMSKPVFFLFLLSTILSAVYAYAQSADIKAQMIARLPVIDSLKAQGVIGETNDGYLGFVSASRMNEDVISAENQDRKKVYEAIAKQQGTSVDVVGRRRAQQIAERAVPGTMLQDGGGNWYKK